MSESVTNRSAGWKNYEKVIFRIFFIYFLLQAVPLDWKFYQQLFSIDWTHLHYGDIFNLAHYTPQILPGPDSYGNWVIILGIALIGAAFWTYSERERERDYNNLYYWIRTIVRYRLAIAILAYGFIKIFPLQSPYPSISNLNTEYGYFDRWKLFSLSLGIVPGYESFLGWVEVALGIGLLYRKTASLTAFVILIFTGNVFVSNIAYDGGEHVYSLYLISLAIFILVYDLQRILSLLVWQKPTAPNKFKPLFSKSWQKYGRWGLKLGVVFFFVLLYGFKTRSGYHEDSYQYPTSKGLSRLAGVYNVSDFRINNLSMPYSRTNPVRWQDIVFEKWNTISIRSNQPIAPYKNNIDYITQNNDDRLYELEGSARRHYYTYEADTVNHLLTLQNRNKYYAWDKLVLHYKLTDASTLQLSGTNYRNDSLYAVIGKIDKKYLLEEAAKQGRRRGLKL